MAVAEAIDGDTLQFADGRVLHVAGIEAVKAGAGAADRSLARAAGERLAGLVGGGPVIIVAAPEAPDRYGRLHGEVRLADGRSAAETLVAAGLARVRLFPGEQPCLAALFAAEEASRAAGAGLWASPDFAVRKADDPSLSARSGLYELVEGRVVSVGHGRSMVFLDFGRDYRHDFSVMVAPALAGRLVLPVDAFVGRQVRVRGVIEESGGPAIRLGDPAEIEVLDGDGGANGAG